MQGVKVDRYTHSLLEINYKRTINELTKNSRVELKTKFKI